MTTRTRLSVLLISTPVLAFIVVGGLLGRASTGDAEFQHLRVFQDVVSLILNNYVEEAKVDKVMDGAMRGLADGLDPDSAYLSARQVKSVESNEALPAGDVGIELTRRYLPACDRGARWIAGGQGRTAYGRLRARHRRQADARPVRVRGRPSAARGPRQPVMLTVIRGNAAEPRQIELVRETAPGAVVTAKMIPPDVGYIRIAAFGPGIAAKLKTQVEDGHVEGGEVPDRRSPSHRGRHVRERARRRPVVRAQRNAGDQGRARRKRPDARP